MEARAAFQGLAVACSLTLGMAACDDPDAELEGAPQVEAAPGVQEAPDTPMGGAVADTTAEALWMHLQSEDYARSWSMWPGTEAFYQGTDPHGALLTTYVDSEAERGLERLATGDAEALPMGSIVVKENYGPDSTLMSVTAMYKAEGYDPEHADWFWMKRLTDGTVEAAGRVDSCIECHQEGTTGDWFFTALPQPGDTMP